jgi:methyl-accepting chemotaxis protein
MQRWIANLSFAQKFTLLGLVALLMAGWPSALVIRQAWADLTVLQSEVDGLASAKALIPLIKTTQQHRGLSSGVLSGNAAMGSDRQQRQQLIDQQLLALPAILAAQNDEALLSAAEGIRRDWVALSGAISKGAITPADSLQRHNRLIAGQIKLLSDVSNTSGLALDADPRSYYMITALLHDMPRLTNVMGQARARGTAMRVTQSQSTADHLQLSTLLQSANALHEDILAAQARVANALPERAHDAAYGALIAQSAAGLQQAAQAVNSVIQAQAGSGPTPAAYFAVMTEAMGAQFALADAGMLKLDGRMHERMSAQRTQAAGNAVVLLLSGLLGGWILWSINRSTLEAVSTAVRAADALAQGDLSQHLSSTSQDEVGQMTNAVGRAIDHLKGVIEGIVVASDSVATAATQIAQGNLDLSARTENQASSLQETASSMEEMSSVVDRSASMANRSRELATRAAQEAEQSGQIFIQVAQRMGAIKGTSSKIADINAVIDGLAFQTNILALNAAVEAARAGEQGRGFAVVASEVRSLAQRSAQAAKEIKGLIQQSVESVDQGYDLASGSTDAITRLVLLVKEVSDMMDEMALSSAQQSQGIAQVNQAVSQLDQSTQQNAALVEQSSAAATSLSEQAQRLLHSVGAFKLR